jgi:transcriptional regulator with XRE-family HTH domain
MAMNGCARIFSRAAQILGGEQQLATHLNVSMEELTRLARLDAYPSAEVFIRLARILTREMRDRYEGPAHASVILGHYKNRSA